MSHRKASHVRKLGLRGATISRHAYLAPHLYRLTTNGALIHLLGARSTRTPVETGSGTVRFDVGKTHDARGVSADGRFGCIVATSDTASVFECTHRRGRVSFHSGDAYRRFHLWRQGHIVRLANAHQCWCVPLGASVLILLRGLTFWLLRRRSLLFFRQ